MTFHMHPLVRTTFVLAALATAVLEAHITPQVTLRKQADVIRASLPTAVRYTATTVHIGQPELQEIFDRAHYRPNTDTVKFYSGENADGGAVGTVVFPQMDTQHGPIEVGVAIGTDGAVTNVLVTRVTAETRPWVLEVERSGVLDRLKGARAGGTPAPLSGGSMTGMPGYIADAIATATYRGLALYAALQP